MWPSASRKAALGTILRARGAGSDSKECRLAGVQIPEPTVLFLVAWIAVTTILLMHM